MRAALTPAVLIATVVMAFAARPATAYPWMIAHGYTSCASCHVDPGGAGQLTAYGRGMSDLLVRWHADPAEAGDEPSALSQQLFGLAQMPEWLNVSANVRGGGLLLATQTVAVYPLVMALDAEATVDLSPFVAHASLGYGAHAVGPAVLWSPNGGPDNALVSREHWLGLKLFDDSLMLRVGRMPLPFGLRNVEHSSFVRSETRTDFNTGQQHGVSVSFANDLLRAEVMGIAGNYQIRPDAVRERGYAGSVELFPADKLGVGASSLVTYAQQDINLGVPVLRQAHGVFARYAPLDTLALLGEGDLLINNDTLGSAAFLQADWSVIPGVHVMPALETLYRADGTMSLPTFGAWAGVAWYALPHTELRFDTLYRESFPSLGKPAGELAVILQLHAYL